MLRVTSGSSKFVFPCSHGYTTEPIVPDAEGSFVVSAVLVEERGPVQFPERPARLVGQVEGDRIVFTVESDATDRQPAVVYGPAQVIYNREPTFERCV